MNLKDNIERKARHKKAGSTEFNVQKQKTIDIVEEFRTVANWIEREHREHAW